MATTHGSNQTEPDEPARRARTAAEQRAQRAQRTSGSDDPEVLAEEIERTREELAETLDAIADKVSPKRVTARTKKKVADSVQSKADMAKEHLHAGAVSAKETVEHAKEAVQEKISGDDSGPDAVVAVTPGVLADRADTAAVVEPAGADIPPATVPSGPPVGGIATYGASPSVPKEALAGAAAALAVVLLVLRKRKRKRTRARGWRAGAR